MQQGYLSQREFSTSLWSQSVWLIDEDIENMLWKEDNNNNKKRNGLCFVNPKWKALWIVEAYYEPLRRRSSKQDFKCRLWNLKRLQIPTGNIRSFCSGDGLCWLIQASNQSSGVFFINEKKAGNVTEGLQTPLEVLNSEKKPMLYFIDSSPWVWRQWSCWKFHSILYVWTESCIRMFVASLQTCPTADINKVIRWTRRDSGGNSVLGALEKPSDRMFWQFRLSCFIVLWGR